MYACIRRHFSQNVLSSEIADSCAFTRTFMYATSCVTSVTLSMTSVSLTETSVKCYTIHDKCFINLDKCNTISYKCYIVCYMCNIVKCVTIVKSYLTGSCNKCNI